MQRGREARQEQLEALRDQIVIEKKKHAERQRVVHVILAMSLMGVIVGCLLPLLPSLYGRRDTGESLWTVLANLPSTELRVVKSFVAFTKVIDDWAAWLLGIVGIVTLAVIIGILTRLVPYDFASSFPSICSLYLCSHLYRMHQLLALVTLCGGAYAIGNSFIRVIPFTLTLLGFEFVFSWSTEARIKAKQHDAFIELVAFAFAAVGSFAFLLAMEHN